MRLELTLPASLRGQTVMQDTLEAVDGSTDTKALLRPILQIIERAVSSGIQQEFSPTLSSMPLKRTCLGKGWVTSPLR